MTIKQEKKSSQQIENEAIAYLKSILLESFSDAKSYWEILTQSELEELKNTDYPIFNLWFNDKPIEFSSLP